jgi:hypothetical protein
MQFRIGENINSVFPHHESIKALWETKWKRPATMGIYPFMDGNIADFEPIFNEIGHLHPPYDFDAYAAAFFPTAEKLIKEAEEAEKSGETAKASSLFLRAAAVYRIARFPVPRGKKQKEAWELNKAVYLRGAQYLNPPVESVKIPHTHGLAGTPEEDSHLSVFARRPAEANENSPVPVLLLIWGLDGYRTEGTPDSNFFTSNGWGYVGVEIPGTGDSPALRTDPESPDRCWSSLLDWLYAQPWVQKNKIVVWGVSTGGYYAMRIAHTHADKLLGVVAQGGLSHHGFDPDWLSKVDNLEYPFE